MQQQPQPAAAPPPAQAHGAAGGGTLPNAYRYIKDLGRGAFGCVVLAEDVAATTAAQQQGDAQQQQQQTAAATKPAPRYVAIKKLPRSLARQRGGGYVLSELLLHSSLRHPHVVRFREVFLSPNNLNVVLEYVPDGTLLGHLQARPLQRLPEPQARWIFQQLVFAVDYCHRKGVASRDIKLENILLDKSARGQPDWPIVKLADLGFAKSDAASSATSRVGTLTYMAPEVLTSGGGAHSGGSSYSGKAADVWSCGVVLYAMLCGALPFAPPPPDGAGGGGDGAMFDQTTLAGSVMALLADMRARRIHFHAQVSAEARDLVCSLLDPDPRRRAALSGVVAHPWFAASLPPSALEANEQYLKLPRGCAQSEDDIRAIVARAAAAPAPAYDDDDDGDGGEYYGAGAGAGPLAMMAA